MIVFGSPPLFSIGHGDLCLFVGSVRRFLWGYFSYPCTPVVGAMAGVIS